MNENKDHDDLLKLKTNFELLVIERDTPKSAVAWQKVAIAARDEEIDRIRTALKPFAAYADALDLDEIPNTTKVKYGELAPGIIALHFRRARVALKPRDTEIKGGDENDDA